MGRSALGRRRGTRRGDSIRTSVLLAVVFCLLVAALTLGMLLGAHVLASPGTNENQPGHGKAGVEQLIRGGGGGAAKAMEELEAIVRRHNRNAADDDKHQQQARPLGHLHGGDTDDDAAANGGKHDGGADAASGKSDRDMTEELHPHGHAQVGEDPTKPYPYSLDKVPSTQSFQSWTAPGGDRFAEYKHGGTPWLVTDEIIEKSDACARSRRYHVKEAMKHAWEGYTKHAYGSDEVLPQSGRANTNWGGMGTTLVDSLDTLWLMGMKDEFWKARDWVRDSLSCTRVGSVSVFETTIRSLGGLLAAYDWSGDKTFLDKANDLGKRLFKAFDTETGLPSGQVALSTGRTNNIPWAGGNAIVAEMGTLQVEFRYLAKAVGNKEFATKSENVYTVLDTMPHQQGLYPYFIRNRQNPPTFANNKLTFGAMGDSLYEYMLKIWLQGGKTEPRYRAMYDRAIDGMHDLLLQTSTPSNLTYIADKSGNMIDHKMDHLVCFMGGLLALGAYTDPEGLQSERAQRDLRTAKVCTVAVMMMMMTVEHVCARWCSNRIDCEYSKGDRHPCLFLAFASCHCPDCFSNANLTYPYSSPFHHSPQQSLTYTCYQMYARMNTGISPEYVRFVGGKDFTIGPGAPHYLLRPEAVESFYILNYLTGDPVYREWGWEVFCAIERYCKTNIAYGKLADVSNVNRAPEDNMESFFLAETLKYLYLLQDPDSEVDILEKHVFNTEAHPMRLLPLIKESSGGIFM